MRKSGLARQPTRPSAKPGGWTVSALGSAREGDRFLPPWHLALDARPDRERREARAVVRGTGLQLVERHAHVVDPPSRRLGRAPNVIVSHALGLDPRLLDVRNERGGLVHLAIEVLPPLIAGGKARAVGPHHVLEVPDDLFGLAQVMVHSGPRFFHRLGPDRGPNGRDDEQESSDEEARHDFQYTVARRACRRGLGYRGAGAPPAGAGGPASRRRSILPWGPQRNVELPLP